VGHREGRACLGEREDTETELPEYLAPLTILDLRLRIEGRELIRRYEEGERHFFRVNLIEASLIGADLSGADLRETRLFRANLSGAILHGADLSEADLTGSRLDDSTRIAEVWRLTWEIVNQSR
jgi:hypothetical protein